MEKSRKDEKSRGIFLSRSRKKALSVDLLLFVEVWRKYEFFMCVWSLQIYSSLFSTNGEKSYNSITYFSCQKDFFFLFREANLLKLFNLKTFCHSYKSGSCVNRIVQVERIIVCKLHLSEAWSTKDFRDFEQTFQFEKHR